MEGTSRSDVARGGIATEYLPAVASLLVLVLSATPSFAVQTGDTGTGLEQEDGNHWAGLITSWQPDNHEHEQIPRVVRTLTEGEKWVVELSSFVEGVDLEGLDPLVRERLSSEKLEELLLEDTPEQRERKRRWLEGMIGKLTVKDQAAAWEAVERHRSRLPALFRACVVVDVASEECEAELSSVRAAQGALQGFERRAGRPAIENSWRILHGQCLDGYKQDQCLDVARHFMSKKAYQDAADLYRKICSAAASRSRRGAACANLGILHEGRWLGTPDPSLARKYLREACDYGNSQACKKLK